MHTHRHRNRNSVGGLVTFLLLLLGIFIFFGMYTDIVSYIFWPFPTVGILIIILIVYSISRSRRNARYRAVQRMEQRTYKQYQPTPNPYWKNQEKDFVPTQKYEQKASDELLFCNYCGIKLEEKANFCVNCGRRLN